MKNRSASDSLKGYFYQFDKTILSILSSNSSSTITVEGIEDIDIGNLSETTSIQCKYLEAQNLVDSAIRKPIKYMIDHYRKNSNRHYYYLYAYFHDETPHEAIIDLDNLKKILTYKEDGKEIEYYKQKNITDDMLKEFLIRFKFEVGKCYDDQKKDVFEKIKEVFSCSDLEVEELYYNKALRHIADLAINKQEARRKTNKKDFIDNLNSKGILFNKWFYELKGKEKYREFIKKWIKKTDSLRSQKQRTIFIDDHYLKNQKHTLNTEQFIKNIIDKYYILNTSLEDTRPWTLILNTQIAKTRNVKRNLVSMGIKFNDGYEDLGFNFNLFKENPIINTKKGDKITKSSFLIKIISSKTYLKNKANLSHEDVVFFCSNKSPDSFFDSDVTLIQIHTDSLEEINDILNSN